MRAEQVDQPSQDEARPRVIAGFGRSGTTWVQDVLAGANRLRTIFEPMHPLVWRRYDPRLYRLREEAEEDPELFQFLARVFYGPFHSLWGDYRLIAPRLVPRAGDLVSPRAAKRRLAYVVQAGRQIARYRGQRRRDQRIVKFVRANLILSWLRRHFDARIVFIIRHPAAVVLSQLKNRWSPERYIERYRTDEKLLATLSEDMRKLLFSESGPIELLTMSWCIENHIALRQANASGIPVIYYEFLVARGLPEWSRILDALDLKALPDESLINRPSQQAWGKKADDPALVQEYSAWMREADAPTIGRIQNVLDIAGEAVYSTGTPMPRYEL